MATMWGNVPFRSRGRGRARGGFYRGRGISRGRERGGGAASTKDHPHGNSSADDTRLKITVQSETPATRPTRDQEKRDTEAAKLDKSGNRENENNASNSKRPLTERLGPQDQSKEGEETIRITVGNEMFGEQGKRMSSQSDRSGRRGSPHRHDPSPKDNRSSSRDHHGSPTHRYKSSYRGRDSPKRDRRGSPSRDSKDRHRSSPSRHRRGSSPRRERRKSPLRDRHGSSPHRERHGPSPHRERRGDKRGSSPSRYRRGISPSRDSRGSPSSRHRSSPSPYSERQSSVDRSPYKSPTRQEMERFFPRDSDIRVEAQQQTPPAVTRDIDFRPNNERPALYNERGVMPTINDFLQGQRKSMETQAIPGIRGNPEFSPSVQRIFSDPSPKLAEFPNPSQPVQRHPLPGFSYTLEDQSSMSPPTMTSLPSQEASTVTRMPLGLPGEQRAIPPPPTAKPKKSILKKSSDNAKQSPVISGFGDRPSAEILPGLVSASDIMVPQSKPLFPSAFPGSSLSQPKPAMLQSAPPPVQATSSMEIDDEEMFLYGKPSNSSNSSLATQHGKDNKPKSSAENSYLLESSLRFLTGGQTQSSSKPAAPVLFDAKATAQLHSLANSVLQSQRSIETDTGNSSSAPSPAQSSTVHVKGLQMPGSSLAGSSAPEQPVAQSYQQQQQQSQRETEHEGVDNNLIQNPMIKGILQSIGFDFEMSKRMQERAKQASGLKTLPKKAEPKIPEPSPSVEEPQFGINQTASFLSGGLSDIELSGSLFKKDEEDVETLVRDAQQNVRQAERKYRDKETKAMQFQNQEPLVPDAKRSPYLQPARTDATRNQHSGSQFGQSNIEPFVGAPPDPRESYLREVSSYDPLHNDALVYERDYDMPPQHLIEPVQRDLYQIPLQGDAHRTSPDRYSQGRDSHRDSHSHRHSSDRDSYRISLERDGQRSIDRDNYDRYPRSISRDRWSRSSDRSRSPDRRIISPGRNSISPGRNSISPDRGSISEGRRSRSPRRRSWSPSRRSISPNRRMSPERRHISSGRRNVSPMHRDRSPGRHSRLRERSESYEDRSRSRDSDVHRTRDSKKDDLSGIKIMRTFATESPKRYIDSNRKKSEAKADAGMQETRTVVASGPVIRRTVLAPKVEAPKPAPSTSAMNINKTLQRTKPVLSAKQREKLMQESADRQRRLEGLERELERLRKQQNELMRKKQRQKDGHKDPVLVENSKLQEEIAQQISSLRKAAEENAKTLKASGDGTKSKTEVKNKVVISKEEVVEETRVVKKEAKTENPQKPVKLDVVYQYIDPGNHWCRTCNHISSNIFEVFQHLHSKRHIQKSDPYDRPWMPEAIKNPSSAPVKKGKEIQVTTLKGVEFLRSTQAFYCTLCSVFSGDELCAEHHLKSEEHNMKYKKHIEDNSFYERGINLDKAAGISMMKEEDKEDSNSDDRKPDKRKPDSKTNLEASKEAAKRRRLSLAEEIEKKNKAAKEVKERRKELYEKRDQNVKESLRKSEKPVAELSGDSASGDQEKKSKTSEAAGKGIKLTLKGEKASSDSAETSKKGKVFSNFTWTKKESKPLVTKGSDIFADDDDDDEADGANAADNTEGKDETSSAEQGKGSKIAIKLTGKTQIKPPVKSAYATWTAVSSKRIVKIPPKPQTVPARKVGKPEDEVKSASLDQFLSIGGTANKKPLPVIKDPTAENTEENKTEAKTNTGKGPSGVSIDLASIPTPKDPPPKRKASTDKESLEDMKLLGIDPTTSAPLVDPKPPPTVTPKGKKKGKGKKGQKAGEKDSSNSPGTKSVQDLFDIFYGPKSQAESDLSAITGQAVSAQSSTMNTYSTTGPPIPAHYPSGPPTFLQNPPGEFYVPQPFNFGPQGPLGPMPFRRPPMPFRHPMNMYPPGPGPYPFHPQPFPQRFGPPPGGFFQGPMEPGPHPYGPRPMCPPMPQNAAPQSHGLLPTPQSGHLPSENIQTANSNASTNSSSLSAYRTQNPESDSSGASEEQKSVVSSEALKSDGSELSSNAEVPVSGSTDSTVPVAEVETPVSSKEITETSDSQYDPSVPTSEVTMTGSDVLTSVTDPKMVGSDTAAASTEASTEALQANAEISITNTDVPITSSEAVVAHTSVPDITPVSICTTVPDVSPTTNNENITNNSIIEESVTNNIAQACPVLIEPQSAQVETMESVNGGGEFTSENAVQTDKSQQESNLPLEHFKMDSTPGGGDAPGGCDAPGGGDAPAYVPSPEAPPTKVIISDDTISSGQTVILQDDMSTLASLINAPSEVSEPMEAQNDLEANSTNDTAVSALTEIQSLSAELNAGHTQKDDLLGEDNIIPYSTPAEFTMSGVPDHMEENSNDFMVPPLSDMINMDASLAEPMSINPEVLADMDYFPGDNITGTGTSLTESLLGFGSDVNLNSQNTAMESSEMETDDVLSNGSGTSMNISDFQVLDECEAD